MFVNAYYVMNDQELPEVIMEEEIKAPNNTLKQTFKDFKIWLLQICDDIRKPHFTIKET